VRAYTDCYDAETEVWNFSCIVFPSNKWAFVEDVYGINRNASSLGRIAVLGGIHCYVHYRFIDDLHTKVEISLDPIERSWPF